MFIYITTGRTGSVGDSIAYDGVVVGTVQGNTVVSSSTIVINGVTIDIVV